MPRKDLCSVFTINGFLRGELGEYRIIVLAANKDDAITYLGFGGHIAAKLILVSRDTKDWTHYDDSTAIGDIFITARGTHNYLPVDADEIEL